MIEIQDKDTEDYISRINNRMATIAKSTIHLRSSYVTDGDSYEVAKAKVKDVTVYILANSTEAKSEFMFGNTSVLINVIDAITTTDIPHFSSDKKTIVLDILNNV